MPGIGVIYNPRSGRNLRDPNAHVRLARSVGDMGVVRKAGSLDELYRVAEDFRKLDIDVLGISGGDGTNGTTITGFLDVYGASTLPQIAFLRGGTMNTVANAIGVRRGPPEGLLERLCRAYAARAARPLQNVERHVLRVSASSPADPSHVDGLAGASVADGGALALKYGFNFGTGLVCGFLAEYYSAGRPPSPLVAAKTLARGVGSAMVGGAMVRRMSEPFRGSVTLDDGTKWPDRDYLAVTGSTVDQLGLNFRPFYRYAERPGAFHVLGIYASPMKLVTQLPRIWRAQPMAEGCTYDVVTSQVTIESRDKPLRYMIDGDLGSCEGPLHVGIGPRVRIVVVS